MHQCAWMHGCRAAALGLQTGHEGRGTQLVACQCFLSHGALSRRQTPTPEAPPSLLPQMDAVYGLDDIGLANRRTGTGNRAFPWCTYWCAPAPAPAAALHLAAALEADPPDRALLARGCEH